MRNPIMSHLRGANTRRHRAVKELRDLAWAAGATSDSLILAILSGAQQRMREVA